jgi:LuxR family maltose regulon positive regulatory protein
MLAEYQSQRRNDSILQAIGLLERLLKAAEAQRSTGSIIEILVAQAVARQASADPKERRHLPLAMESLERALTLAEPEGYFRLFVDEGEPMHLPLLDFRARIRNLSSGQSHPLLVYVERLLSGFGRTEEIHPMANPQKANLTEPAALIELAPLLEALSERELEVLKLLRTELSGQEIAGQLVISPNTFRTHTNHIFSKLGVNNRRAAVCRAEELHLF